MITTSLVKIVKSNLEEMTKLWTEEARKSDVMKTYHKFDETELKKRGSAVFENLVKWLEAGAHSEEVEHYFEEVGKSRLNEGFPLTEVHYAVYLTKKIFWSFVDWRDAISGKFETAHATQVMSVFNNYFDLGNFHITEGYFHELFENLDDNKKFSKTELKNILLLGKKELENIEEDEFIWRPV